MANRKKIPKSWLVVIIISLFITFYQLPYYVTTPGMAKSLSDVVQVEGGFEESGEFMLTTIRMGKANLLQLGWAKVRDYHHIYPEEDIRPSGVTETEFHERQLHMMDSSKEAAIAVAYQKANKFVEIKNNGIYVMDVMEGMPAAKQLEAGDRIYAINNIKIESADEFINIVGQKKIGDKVTLQIDRGNDMNKRVEVKLASFPNNEDKAGLGIRLVTDQSVVVKPEVTIDTNEIGGPSAGLMFTLEIYNQLTKKDYTKGYKIAGTGTMNFNGEVGPIGGIEQKIVAADNAGADVFFAPNENGKKDSDYANAVKTAKDIETDMKIVPVDTFDDALSFLKELS